MATCAISGTIKDLSETAIEAVTIYVELLEAMESSTNWIAGQRLEVSTSDTGTFTLTVLRSVEAKVTILMPTGTDAVRPVSYVIQVPNSATANFTDLI